MSAKLRVTQESSRRGAIIVLAAILMVVMLAFVAFTVDVGVISLTRTQLQAAADAGALSGAQELGANGSPSAVRNQVEQAVLSATSLHRNAEQASVTINPSTDIVLGKIVYNNGNSESSSGNGNTNTSPGGNANGSSGYQILWGDNQTPYSVVKVRALRSMGSSGDNRLPLSFAPIIGTKKAEVWAEAIATFQPRDIMVVLDYSGSMNDDSCLNAISRFSRPTIENNLQLMWTELGSPVYGKLTFTPKYPTLNGAPAAGPNPHIDVTYKRRTVDVSSTMPISQVRLQFSNGSTQTLNGSGNSGTFPSSAAGSDIVKVWVKSGSNASLSVGNYGEQFDITRTSLKLALGLNIPYPYPGGSWDEYMNKVEASSGAIKNAGYRDMYGYLTWLEYLQTSRYSYADTPDLWKTSEQPVGAMKDAVDVFVDYIKSGATGDEMGLSIYTHPQTSGAILEHGLSNNLDQIKDTTRHRQAGHYKPGTNISAGMRIARIELQTRARPQAFQMMVLMTDGEANEPGNSTQARNAVLVEAQLAKQQKIKVMTISLGSGADMSLLQQVADETGGIHFNVPGGQSIAAVRSQLEDAFKEIAAARPLKLISGSAP